GIAVLDIDNDRDLDLVVTADGGPPKAILNDRLGQFHEVELKVPSPPALAGLLATDFDGDDRTDLVATDADGPGRAWRNTPERTTGEATRPTFETWPINATGWRSAQSIDLDLDGRPDLLGLPAASSKPGAVVLPAWARNEGKRFATQVLSFGLESP